MVEGYLAEGINVTKYTFYESKIPNVFYLEHSDRLFVITESGFTLKKHGSKKWLENNNLLRN